MYRWLNSPGKDILPDLRSRSACRWQQDGLLQCTTTFDKMCPLLIVYGLLAVYCVCIYYVLYVCLLLVCLCVVNVC